MTKDADIADLIGDDKPAAKKAAPKKDAAPKADKPAKADAKAKPAAKKPAKADAKAKPAAKKPAKDEKPAKSAKADTKAKAPKAKTAKEPVVFAEGERDELIARIKKMVKKPINSRELAEKLGVPTRKLRPVLYSAQRAEIITLEAGESRIAGMTVHPA